MLYSVQLVYNLNGYKYEHICPCLGLITHIYIFFLPLVNFRMGHDSSTRKGRDKKKMRIRGRISWVGEDSMTLIKKLHRC